MSWQGGVVRGGRDLGMANYFFFFLKAFQVDSNVQPGLGTPELGHLERVPHIPKEECTRFYQK